MAYSKKEIETNFNKIKNFTIQEMAEFIINIMNKQENFSKIHCEKLCKYRIDGECHQKEWECDITLEQSIIEVLNSSESLF